MNFPWRAEERGNAQKTLLQGLGPPSPALQPCSRLGRGAGPVPPERQAAAGRPWSSARSPLPLLPQRHWSFKTWSFHRNFARPSSQPSQDPAAIFAAASQLPLSADSVDPAATQRKAHLPGSLPEKTQSFRGPAPLLGSCGDDCAFRGTPSRAHPLSQCAGPGLGTLRGGRHRGDRGRVGTPAARAGVWFCFKAVLRAGVGGECARRGRGGGM